jgi:hypothetical protein
MVRSGWLEWMAEGDWWSGWLKWMAEEASSSGWLEEMAVEIHLENGRLWWLGGCSKREGIHVVYMAG